MSEKVLLTGAFGFCIIILVFSPSCFEQPKKDKLELSRKTAAMKEVEKNVSDQILVDGKKESIKTKKFICYTNDSDQSLRIIIAFDEQERATQVRYKGQQDFLNLNFVAEKYSEGGAHPTLVEYYQELFKGEVIGTYELTRSGIWYYVDYHRGTDGKNFKFTIDHSADNFTSTPCF